MVVTSLSYAFSLSLKVICFSFLIYPFGELTSYFGYMECGDEGYDFHSCGELLVIALLNLLKVLARIFASLSM